MKLVAANLAVLERDLDAGMAHLRASVERDPAVWDRGLPGKWSAGQHAEHVAIALGLMASAAEARVTAAIDGSLPPRPGRDPLQALFIAAFIKTGFFPRGGKSPPSAGPTANPVREAVLDRITLETHRLQWVAARLTPDQCDRLWITNPFIQSWHYTLPEVFRVQAVHARHHAKQIEEIAAATVAR